jgi:hypothetical protein
MYPVELTGYIEFRRTTIALIAFDLLPKEKCFYDDPPGDSSRFVFATFRA